MIKIPRSASEVKSVDSRRVAGWPIGDEIVARTQVIQNEWTELDRHERAVLLDENGRLSPERVEAMLLYLGGVLQSGSVVGNEAA